MPTEAKRAAYSQKALDCYARAHVTVRCWRSTPANDDIAECDIVDLITDLLLLARLKGHDPTTIVSKAERHVYAETRHQIRSVRRRRALVRHGTPKQSGPCDETFAQTPSRTTLAFTDPRRRRNG